MRAGFTPDVAHPCVEDMDRWTDAGIVQPIDTSKINNWNNVFQRMRDTRGISYDGDVYFVPMDWGNSSIIYRTDLYEGEESWEMLFDERYKGRIGARNGSANAWAAAQILGFDMFAPTQEELEGRSPTCCASSATSCASIGTISRKPSRQSRPARSSLPMPGTPR